MDFYNVLYNSRLVIPEPLQADILSRIHEGHQGIVKCRAMAKTSVWWPGLSKQIEELIKACPICEKHKEVRPEPLRPSTTPDYPFQKLGMDLFEWKGQIIYWLWTISRDGLKSLFFRRQHHNEPWNTANQFFQDTVYQK